MDAQYCNPHKLSFGGIGACPLVSEMVSQSLDQIIFKDITESIDVIDILRSRSDLEEAAQPGIITAELKRYVDMIPSNRPLELIMGPELQTSEASTHLYVESGAGMGIRWPAVRHLESHIHCSTKIVSP